MDALEKETIECLAEEAEDRAAGVDDAWMKEQWQCIATAYRDLAQINLAPTTNAVEQIQPIKGHKQWTIH